MRLINPDWRRLKRLITQGIIEQKFYLEKMESEMYDKTAEMSTLKFWDKETMVNVSYRINKLDRELSIINKTPPHTGWFCDWRNSLLHFKKIGIENDRRTANNVVVLQSNNVSEFRKLHPEGTPAETIKIWGRNGQEILEGNKPSAKLAKVFPKASAIGFASYLGYKWVTKESPASPQDGNQD